MLEILDTAETGRRIREVREAAGLSRDDLGKALDAPYSTVAGIENGKGDSTSLPRLIRVANACAGNEQLMGCPPEEVLDFLEGRVPHLDLRVRLGDRRPPLTKIEGGAKRRRRARGRTTAAGGDMSWSRNHARNLHERAA